MQLARATFGDNAPGDVNMLVRLSWEIGGAVAFGCLVGALFALYLRYVGREVTLALLVVCLVLSQVGMSQRVEPLLAAMAAGIVIANVAVAQGETLKAAIQIGRAATARRVLRRDRDVAAPRYARDRRPGGGRDWPLARVGLIWVGVRTGLHVSGVKDSAGEYVWMGLISQAGITLGLAAAVATEFPTWGAQVQMLLVALIAIDELVGPALFRTGLVRAGEIDAHAPRPLLVVSNREPYLHNLDEEGRITCATATGGVAVALDALMRERGGTWIAHGAGTADRETVDDRDKIQVPPGSPAYDLRRLWIPQEEFDALLRRVRERRVVAALSSRRRPAEVPAGRLGGIQEGERAVCRGDRSRNDDARYAGVPAGLPPRDGGVVSAPAPAARAHGAVLAYPVAESRSAADVPVASRAAGRA